MLIYKHIYNFILVILLIILLVNYGRIINFFKNNENYENVNPCIVPISKNKIVPYNDITQPDSNTLFIEHDEKYNDTERNRIDKYCNNFFAFNDRINNTSHLQDVVDNINITNKAQDFDIGMNISTIYDNLVKN